MDTVDTVDTVDTLDRVNIMVDTTVHMVYAKSVWLLLDYYVWIR